MIIYIIMAESIEYSSIVKFINDDIIQEKLAHLVKHVGGAAKTSESESKSSESASAELKKTIEERVPTNSMFQAPAVQAVKQFLNDSVPGARDYPVAIGLLALGLASAALYYANTEDDSDTKNENLMYILGATIVSFMLAGPGSALVTYVSNTLFGIKEPIGKVNISSEVSDMFKSRSNFGKVDKVEQVKRMSSDFTVRSYERQQLESDLKQLENNVNKTEQDKNEIIRLKQEINNFDIFQQKEDADSLEERRKEYLEDMERELQTLNKSKTPNQSRIAEVEKNISYANSKNFKGGNFASITKLVTDFVKGNMKTIVAGLGATALAGYFLVDPKLSLSENMARLWTSGSKSVSFTFNSTSGNIDINGKITKNVKLNSSSHFGITGIVMVIKGDEITYTVNGTPLKAHSYIEGKPIHTALVMAYLVKDKHFNKYAPHSSVKSDSAYVYSIEDDGSVRLFNKDSNGARGAEIASINTAIRKQLEGNDTGASTDRAEVCRDLFSVGVNDKTCANHFYNILGKSAMGMLKNMGEAASKDKIVQNLLNAKPHIKYEILKNLDWKMKVSNGKKEMATPDQWLERLEQDARPAIKSLAAQYKEYLNTTAPHVKTILEKMVMDLNNNTRLLDEKYKEAVQAPQPAVRRRRARLSAAQVSSLRNQVLTENVALNTPMPVPGYPGFNLIELAPTQFRGGAHGTYEQHFENIKQSLAGFNQKLSSDTDRKIKSKISEINDLSSKLDNIHKNITEYTKILRTEKYPTGISRTVTLSDVENLINQYKSGTQEQTKQIVTLSTAFGKIKMLLEKQEVNSAVPSSKNFMFDL